MNGLIWQQARIDVVFWFTKDDHTPSTHDNESNLSAISSWTLKNLRSVLRMVVDGANRSPRQPTIRQYHLTTDRLSQTHRSTHHYQRSSPNDEDDQQAKLKRLAPLIYRGDWCRAYIKQGKRKESTNDQLEDVERNLTNFFGADRPITSINAGDAEDFRIWLETEAREEDKGKGVIKESGLPMSG